MKRLDSILNGADFSSFPVDSALSFDEAVAEYNSHINIEADSSLVQADPVEIKLEGGTLPPSRFSAVIGSAHFECFFQKGSDKRLVVFLSGARTRNNGKDVAPYPTFSSWSWYTKTGASVLCIDDPMYHLYPTLALGWFYGTNDEDYRQATASLVGRIAELLGVENSDITLYGRSGGGTAAICISSFIEGSAAVAVNPQLDIANYKFNKSFTEITGLNPSDEAFLDRNDFEKIIKSNPQNTFLILSNLASETDYEIDLKYLNDRFDLKPVYGVSACDNLFLWLYYACGETSPHNAFDNPALFKIIMAVLECLKVNGSAPAGLVSFANDYFAERYELLYRKRDINQKAVSRRDEIENLKVQLAEKDGEIEALKNQKSKGIFSKLKNK